MTVVSTAVAVTSGVVTSNKPASAVQLTSLTLVSPTTLTIPGGGFTGGQTFTVQSQWSNPLNQSFNISLRFQLVEQDPVGSDTFNVGPSNFTIGSGLSTVTNFVTLSAGNLNSTCDVASCTASTGRVFEGSQLEFSAQAPTFTETAVPEPLTILGSGMALGFGALFKKEYSKKQKKVKSLEKQKA